MSRVTICSFGKLQRSYSGAGSGSWAALGSQGSFSSAQFTSSPFLSCDWCRDVLPDKRMPLQKDPWSGIVQFDKTLKERSKINKTHKLFYGLAQLTRVEAYSRHAIRVQ